MEIQCSRVIPQTPSSVDPHVTNSRHCVVRSSSHPFPVGALANISIDLPGLTILKVHDHHLVEPQQQEEREPPRTNSLAMIELTGDSSALLAAVQVLSDGQQRTNTMQLRLQYDPTLLLSRKGFLRTQLWLARALSVHSVTSLGSGQVVVKDRVLANYNRQSQLELVNRGRGDLLVDCPRDRLHVQDISLMLTGRGNLQLWARRGISASSLWLNNSGRGDLRLISRSTLNVSSLIENVVLSSGSLCVSATALAPSRVFTMKSSESGSMQWRVQFPASGGGKSGGCEQLVLPPEQATFGTMDKCAVCLFKWLFGAFVSALLVGFAVAALVVCWRKHLQKEEVRDDNDDDDDDDLGCEMDEGSGGGTFC